MTILVGNNIRYIPAQIRREVNIEAGFRCAICKGTSALELHHIIPFEKGGETSTNNLILLCAVCHRRVHRGEISREDLRAFKKLILNTPSEKLQKDELKKIITDVFKETILPELDFLQDIATQQKTTVLSMINETFGYEKTQMLMQAIYDYDRETVSKLFYEMISNEQKNLTFGARIRLPFAFIGLYWRKDGTNKQFNELVEKTNGILLPIGALGKLSLTQIIILSNEVPDQYMGLPYVRISILGQINLDPIKIDEELSIKYLEQFGLAYETQISDVEYDYRYYYKFTHAGLSFQKWLLSEYNTTK